MTAPDVKHWVTRQPLLVSILLSLLLHLMTFVVIDAGARLGWWSSALLPAFLRQRSAPTELSMTEASLPQINEASIPLPLLLLDVDPAAAVEEAPKDAKFLAPISTAAANPDAVAKSDMPKIDGEQEKYLKPTPTSMDKTGPTPVPVAAPQPEIQRTTAPMEDQSGSKPGDLAKAKPAEDATKIGETLDKRLGDPQPESKARPRTLAEAERMNPNLAGRQMKQDGGARRRGSIGFDAKQSELGEYFRNFVRDVQNNWYIIIDSRRTVASTQTGEVKVVFRLHDDGSVRGVHVESTTVDAILSLMCQRAIEDVHNSEGKRGHYQPWPADMRRMIGSTSHEFKFTFYYE